jgi:hypothetical protein
MVSKGSNKLSDLWWLSRIPGLVRAVVVAMDPFGDRICDSPDPNLRRS